MPVYTVTVRNRAAAVVLTLAILGAGAALFVLGLALLAALGVAGGVLGAGMVAYRALRGRGRPRDAFGRAGPMGLDPSLEVFSDRHAIGDSPTSRGHDERLPPVGG